VWDCISGNGSIKNLKLKYSDFFKAKIVNNLPHELEYDFILHSFRDVVKPYEIFEKIFLDEIVKRLDIVRFNNWLEQEFNEMIKLKGK